MSCFPKKGRTPCPTRIPLVLLQHYYWSGHVLCVSVCLLFPCHVCKRKESMCGSKIHYRGDPFFFFVFAHATTHIPPPLFCFHIQPNARIETIQQHQCFVLTKIKISVDAHAEPFAGRVGTPTTDKKTNVSHFVSAPSCTRGKPGSLLVG